MLDISCMTYLSNSVRIEQLRFGVVADWTVRLKTSARLAVTARAV